MQSQGPFTLTGGTTITLRNPMQARGAANASTAVITNLSPFVLVIGGPNGTKTVSPFNVDVVEMATTPADLSVTSVSVGGTVATSPQLYVDWYGPGDHVPGTYPASLPAQAILETAAPSANANTGLRTALVTAGFADSFGPTGNFVMWTAEIGVVIYTHTGGTGGQVSLFDSSGSGAIASRDFALADETSQPAFFQWPEGYSVQAPFTLSLLWDTAPNPVTGFASCVVTYR